MSKKKINSQNANVEQVGLQTKDTEKTEKVKQSEIKNAKSQNNVKKSKKDKKDKKDKGSLKRKARETVAELKNVTWPTFGEVCKRTGVVLVVVLVFAVIIFGMDYGLGALMTLLTKK